MEMMTLMATGSETGSTIPWLQPAIIILSLAAGSGGVVAWLRLRHDRRMGIAQQESTEDDAISNHWKSIIEVQTKSLLEPMTSRLQTLEGKVTTLEGELLESRRKYWSAITFLRTLYTWIARLPADVDTSSVPQPPANLAEDM